MILAFPYFFKENENKMRRPLLLQHGDILILLPPDWLARLLYWHCLFCFAERHATIIACLHCTAEPSLPLERHGRRPHSDRPYQSASIPARLFLSARLISLGDRAEGCCHYDCQFLSENTSILSIAPRDITASLYAPPLPPAHLFLVERLSRRLMR